MYYLYRHNAFGSLSTFKKGSRAECKKLRDDLVKEGLSTIPFVLSKLPHDKAVVKYCNQRKKSP